MTRYNFGVKNCEPELDEVVVDEPVESRVPTLPMPMGKGSLEIDCTDGVDVAEFLEFMAKLLRTRRKIRIIVE